MPKFDLVVSTDIKRSARVMQLEGLFELATGKAYTSVTSNPAMIQHRARSKNWNVRRALGRVHFQNQSSAVVMEKTSAASRFTASFDYTGPMRRGDARAFGVIQ